MRLISPALFRYILVAARRDRIFLAVIMLCAVVAALCVFFGSSATSEKQAFVLVYTAGLLRIVGMAGLVLFVVFYLRNAFDRREIDFLLAKPVTRTSYIITHTTAFVVLAFIIAGIVSVGVIVVAPDRVGAGTLYWGATLIFEYCIMAWAALFFAMVVRSAASCALICFVFYGLARSIGNLFGIIDTGATPAYLVPLEWIMQVVSIIIPRLDLMAQTAWLVYDDIQEMQVLYLLAHSCAFGAVLILAAVIDLRRRQF
jgi:hypothetical protein